MKKVFNHLVIPFTDACFSRLRTDDNVNNGYFRIGRIILETRVNNSFVIIAKIVEDARTRRDIGFYADALVSELKEQIKNYEDGLICAANLLNEVAFSAEHYHDEAEHSECAARFSGCDNYACPAVKVPGSEKQTEKMEKFISDYDSK